MFYKERTKWPYYVAAGVVLLLLLGISGWFVFFDKDDQSSTAPPIEDTTSGNGGLGNNGAHQPTEPPEEEDITNEPHYLTLRYPLKQEKLTDYTYEVIGNETYLHVENESYLLTTDTILFNAEKEQVVVTTALAKKPAVQVFYADNKQERKQVQLVLIGGNPTALQLTASTGVVKEGEESYFINEPSQMKYRLYEGTELVNAYSQAPFLREKLRAGDRILYVTGVPEEKVLDPYVDFIDYSSFQPDILAESVSWQSYQAADIQKAYVIPSTIKQESKQ